MMLPSSSLKLHLSKMNMFGIGNRMMRRIMKRKGIDSLETLRRQAIDNGVEFIACQMSMEVMGVQREELLDNVTVGGVATYMERAGKANVNLFICIHYDNAVIERIPADVVGNRNRSLRRLPDTCCKIPCMTGQKSHSINSFSQIRHRQIVPAVANLFSEIRRIAVPA